MGNSLSNNFGKSKKIRRNKNRGNKIVYRGYEFITIRRSKKLGKKFDAIFRNIRTGRQKVISFGAKGMSDYTKHKDRQRMERYNKRHRRRENWNNLMTAGALSKWILWNKPSLKSSIADYKRRLKSKR